MPLTMLPLAKNYFGKFSVIPAVKRLHDLAIYFIV